MIVIDASVLATALADDDRDGDRARARMAGEPLVAPHLLDLEVLSVLRRLVHRGRLPLRRADRARHDLAELPIERAPHQPLVGRCWELRENLTTYDGVYVALAEALEVPLITADARLAEAPGPRCRIELLAA